MTFGIDDVERLATAYVTTKLNSGTAGVLDRILDARSIFGKLEKGKPSTATPGSHDWLRAAQARPDPMLDIYWYVQLPPIGKPLSWEYVEEAQLPFIDFDSVQNYRAGKNYHYPNHYNLNTLQLKFYGDVKGNSLSYLRAWQSLIIDTSTGLYNVPTKYKKNIAITILDAAQFVVTKFTYLGCWPASIDAVTVGNAQTGRITPTVTFHVDEQIIDVLGGSEHDSGVSSATDNLNKTTPKIPSASAFPDVFNDALSSVKGAADSAFGMASDALSSVRSYF